MGVLYLKRVVWVISDPANVIPNVKLPGSEAGEHWVGFSPAVGCRSEGRWRMLWSCAALSCICVGSDIGDLLISVAFRSSKIFLPDFHPPSSGGWSWIASGSGKGSNAAKYPNKVHFIRVPFSILCGRAEELKDVSFSNLCLGVKSVPA